VAGGSAPGPDAKLYGSAPACPLTKLAHTSLA